MHVVRAFESDRVPHADGNVEPRRDLEAVDMEFLLSDLVTVEKRLQKLRDGLARGAFKENKVEAQQELALFEQMNEALSEERPLRTLTFSDEQEKILARLWSAHPETDPGRLQYWRRSEWKSKSTTTTRTPSSPICAANWRWNWPNSALKGTLIPWKCSWPNTASPS
ncbi:MAG: hypothetical protein M5U34_21225 [Chloroflexi bacterium]|nr:hypothetical protein [Chloroflexota bacterium]